MTVPRSVAEVITRHVLWELESIDRMYLNVYVPALQCEQGVVRFFRHHRGQPFASSALMDPITKRFVAGIHTFAHTHGIPVITFAPGQRKEDVAAAYRARFRRQEGVLFIGKAQEKTSVFRTERRRNPRTGKTYPWIVRSTAMVNHYYFYCVDRDFGPFFLKFCSYFPYTAKLCLNGHEYAKRQLSRAAIAFDAPIRGARRRSATASRPRSSPPSCASGSPVSPIRSPPATAAPATATSSPSSKPSFPSRRSSTGPSPAASSSKKSSAKTSTSAAPIRSP